MNDGSGGERLLLGEERAAVSKRRRTTGTVRVRVSPTTNTTVASIDLMQERVEVQRVLVGRIVDQAPITREVDGVTIIPVLEEVLVVTKQLILKEELHIRRVVQTKVEQHTVMLRRDEATIERLPAPTTETQEP